MTGPSHDSALSTVLLLPFLGGGPSPLVDADLRELFEMELDGELLLDPGLRVRRANPAARRIFRFGQGGLEGRAFSDLIAPGSHPQLSRAVTQASGPMAGRMPMELEGQAADGSVFPLEMVLRRFQRSGSAGFAVVVRDLREHAALVAALVERAAQLARSNRDLEEFASVASHDLREPLRMVGSYTQLVAERYHGRLDKEADEFLAFAREGATRMEHLIDALREYSRLGTRGEPFVPVSMEGVLKEALQNLEPAIEKSGAKITSDPLPEIDGDRTQLVQLFQNLLGNAIKFRGPAAPQVQIRAVAQGEAVRFSVSDNGIGIPPDQQERLFVIFQRLHGREEFEGTGIGLAVAKKVVERHRGQIWLESTGEPGQGTAFYFQLPVHRPPEPEAILGARRAQPQPQADEFASNLIMKRLRELV